MEPSEIIKQLDVPARLSGRTVLITGAGAGMGRGHALRAAREGANVVVTDVDATAGNGVVEAIEQAGGTAMFHHLDVSSESDWIATLKAAKERFGPVTGLVNNAALFGSTPIQDTPIEDWNRLAAINVRGTFLGCKHVRAHMIEAGGGTIVNVSSGLALVGRESQGPYVPTKGAVTALGKALMVEYTPDSIRVNTLHPGLTNTPMNEQFFPTEELRKYVLGVTLTERFADPEEVSAAIAFLLSDESSYINGADIVVDGGYTTV